MKQYMPLLNQSVLFGGLAEEHLEAILSIAAEKE